MSENPFGADTPPWGNIGSPAEGRKVTWGKPADVAPDSAPVPRRARRAAKTGEQPAVPSAPDAGFGDVFGAGQPSGRPMPPPPADPFDAPIEVDPFSSAQPETPTQADGFAGLFGGPQESTETSESFADMFGESSAAPDPAVEVSSGFGSLFAPVDSPSDEPTADAGFGAMFGDVTPSSEAEPAADQPVDGVEPKADEVAVVADVESVDAPSPFPAFAAAAATSPSAAEPATAPAAAGAAVDVTADEPASSDGGRRLDLAARRRAADEARAVRATVSPEVARLAHEDRYARAAELYEQVHRILGAAGSASNPHLSAFSRNARLTRDHALDRAQRMRFQELMEPLLATAGVRIHNPQDRGVLFDMAYDELIGIGPLGPLWRDDSVSEIMVSGPDKVTIERSGRLEITPVRFQDAGHLQTTVRALAAQSEDDRAVNRVNPLVTIQLPGARVQFVLAPLAVSGTAIAIRKFGALMDMDRLLSFGSLSQEMAAFLSDSVVARATVLVSGGTGSGKTTFINALSGYIPDTERVVTIEDALELQLRNTHVEAFVTKEAASADDQIFFGQDDILKATLRMRPDRIIVGEIRDTSGCAVMLEAANTGHDGTMTTVHANSGIKAIERLTKLLRKSQDMPYEVARAEVTDAIDLVVQVVKERGRRFVSEISLVVSPEEGEAQIVPMFSGTFPRDASAPQFRRVGSVRPDTDLASKMSEVGVDPTTWE